LKKELPDSKAATRRAYNVKINKRAQKEWMASARYRHPHNPNQHWAHKRKTYHANTPHLHRIGKVKSPVCPTTKQYFTTCYYAQHTDPRERMKADTTEKKIIAFTFTISIIDKPLTEITAVEGG